MSWFFLLIASIALAITLAACGGQVGQNNATSCDGSEAQVTMGNTTYVVTYHEWSGILAAITPNPGYTASPTQPAAMTTITDNQGNDVLQFLDRKSHQLSSFTVRWNGCIMKLSPSS
jgi:hypothetical protein